MSRVGKAAAVIALSLITGFASQGSAATLAEAMERLSAVADGYPPRVTDADRKEIVELWRWAEAGMLEYRAGRSKPDKNAEYLLGEIYRLGHNLDMPEASEKAIAHFRAAIAIDPADSNVHLRLGRHLTFMNEVEEGQRELLLGVALDPRGASDRTLYDLAHSCYLQQQFAMAAAFAERYLAMHPDDPAIKLILDTSRKALAGGAPPKTITVPR